MDHNTKGRSPFANAAQYPGYLSGAQAIVDNEPKQSDFGALSEKAASINNEALRAFDRLHRLADNVFGTRPEPAIAPTPGLPPSASALQGMHANLDGIASMVRSIHEQIDRIQTLA